MTENEEKPQIDRAELTSLVAYSLGWEWEPAEGVPSVAECLSDTIDALEEWIAARDAAEIAIARQKVLALRLLATPGEVL